MTFLIYVTLIAHTMSLTLRYPAAKTMAFGGVATGNKKAKDDAMVHGIMKYSGFTPIRTA